MAAGAAHRHMGALFSAAQTTVMVIWLARQPRRAAGSTHALLAQGVDTNARHPQNINHAFARSYCQPKLAAYQNQFKRCFIN